MPLLPLPLCVAEVASFQTPGGWPLICETASLVGKFATLSFPLVSVRVVVLDSRHGRRSVGASAS